jgi:hypothetical protein
LLNAPCYLELGYWAAKGDMTTARIPRCLPFALGNVVSLQDSLFDEASHWRFNPLLPHHHDPVQPGRVGRVCSFTGVTG